MPSEQHAQTAEAPLFRRPGRDDAMQLARATYLAGERIDMQVLAARVGVGRTTLYRWVGSREQLIGDVLAALGADVIRATAERARGNGLERFLSTVRGYGELLIGTEAFREFLRREPEVALRVSMSRHSPVFERSVELTTAMLDDALADLPEGRSRELAEIVNQIISALVSAPFAIGDEPDLDRALSLIRTVLEAEQNGRTEAA